MEQELQICNYMCFSDATTLMTSTENPFLRNTIMVWHSAHKRGGSYIIPVHSYFGKMNISRALNATMTKKHFDTEIMKANHQIIKCWSYTQIYPKGFSQTKKKQNGWILVCYSPGVGDLQMTMYYCLCVTARLWISQTWAGNSFRENTSPGCPLFSACAHAETHGHFMAFLLLHCLATALVQN